jgi:hypothetical protein
MLGVVHSRLQRLMAFRYHYRTQRPDVRAEGNLRQRYNSNTKERWAWFPRVPCS